MMIYDEYETPDSKVNTQNDENFFSVKINDVVTF